LEEEKFTMEITTKIIVHVVVLECLISTNIKYIMFPIDSDGEIRDARLDIERCW
jgi:hypothetical protein